MLRYPNLIGKRDARPALMFVLSAPRVENSTVGFFRLTGVAVLTL